MAIGNRASAVPIDLESVTGLQSLQGNAMILGVGSTPSAQTSTIAPPSVSPPTGLGM